MQCRGNTPKGKKWKAERRKRESVLLKDQKAIGLHFKSGGKNYEVGRGIEQP